VARPGVTRAEPDTFVVHIPIAFARGSGRKALITPGGSPTRAPLRPHANGALITALARAFRWRKQLETGVYATVAEIAAAEGINDSYASRILRLTLLAPDIVEVILDRRHPTGITLDRLMRPFPVAWERQRSAFGETTG
jgi:hypothetical protein